MTDFPHGEQRGYSRGCHCDDCKAAHAAYTRRHRGRDLPAKQIPHGTANGYVNYRCRCTPCSEAARLAQWRRRQSRRDHQQAAS